MLLYRDLKQLENNLKVLEGAQRLISSRGVAPTSVSLVSPIFSGKSGLTIEVLSAVRNAEKSCLMFLHFFMGFIHLLSPER